MQKEEFIKRRAEPEGAGADFSGVVLFADVLEFYCDVGHLKKFQSFKFQGFRVV
jgi:hypothetical protein